MATPARNPRGKRSENSDPNHDPLSATPKKPTIKKINSSPKTHSARTKNSATMTPRTPAMPRGKKPVASSSSQKRSSNKKKKKGLGIENEGASVGVGVGELEGSSKVRKMRSMMLEEAMSSVPESGAGRVMHLVKAFERLLSFAKVDKGDGDQKTEGRVVNWALPGLRQQPRSAAEETDVSSYLNFATTPDRSSVDSNGDRLSWGSSTSYGDQRSRSKSTCSSGRSWNSKLRATSQQPFKLRTEQRGKLKEESFLNKMKQMLLEEEKQRIPIAQGLPWTTDNPECLVKPSLKESTEPVDLVLHSDVRAVERAEFDIHVAERLTFIEQIKLERERLRKLEEEEEVRRLRRELVPKAQPMPYFDRPFVPKKSQKTTTVPKEPSPTVSKEPSPRTPRTHTKKTSVRKSLKLGHGRLREER